MGQACGQQQAEQWAVGILGLRIGREVPVDDLGNAHAFEQGSDDGQRAEGATLLGGGLAEPVETHDEAPVRGEGTRPSEGSTGPAQEEQEHPTVGVKRR